MLWIKSISTNQTHTGLWPAHAWFKNNFFMHNNHSYNVLVLQWIALEGYMSNMVTWLYTLYTAISVGLQITRSWLPSASITTQIH